MCSVHVCVSWCQSLSCVPLLCEPVNYITSRTSLSFTISRSLLNLMPSELLRPSSHLIICHLVLLLLSVFPSIRIFPNQSALCIRWPKCCSSSISPSNEYSGLISFRMDWFDLAVQETLKSLLQHHSSKASILWCSAFFVV